MLRLMVLPNDKEGLLLLLRSTSSNACSFSLRFFRKSANSFGDRDDIFMVSPTGGVCAKTAPREKRWGGYPQVLPTNGKHLSHNVYYESDYVQVGLAKSLISLRTY